jgi:hypothetical protein
LEKSPWTAQHGSASAQSSRQSRPAPSVSMGRCQVGPGASPTPPVSLSSSWAENRYAPDPLSRPLPSQTHPLPLLARVATPTKLPPTSRPPVTTSRLKGVRVCAYPPEPSRWLRCAVMSHRHCCCSAAARHCSSRGAHAKSSATKSSCRPLHWLSGHGRKHAV